MDDDPAFYSMDLDHLNMADLTHSMAETLSPLGTEDTALYGIVSERDGGIIAYAIGRAHAREIVVALLR